MKIAVIFDTPHQGYGHADHVAQMEYEFAERPEPDMEYQVGEALISNGHEVRYVGVFDDISDGIEELREFEPELVFNCAESFAQIDRLDYMMPAMLESEGYNYTGSPPLALMVTRNKGMSKKILEHHGIKVPRFRTYRRGEAPSEPLGLQFPMMVKPLQMDASEGIALVSVVDDLEGLADRVKFVHESIGGSAIVEEFVVGRELYVPVMGNGDNVEVLPIVEMVFDKEVSDTERIATKAAKWDEAYRKNRGIKNVLARRIADRSREQIEQACRTAYRVLWLRDYARFDVRLDADGVPWMLEANANPYLSFDHEIAKAAKKLGMDYDAFIQRIVDIAVARRR